MPELITLAKSKPGQLNYATGGSSTPHHLRGRRGRGPCSVQSASEGVLAVMKGETSFMFPNAPNAITQAKAGKVKTLAVTTPKRLAWLPGIPTAAEAGMPGFEMVAWFGLVAPAGTPPAVVQRINVELRKVLGTPAVRESLQNQGFEIMAGTPEEFGGQGRLTACRRAAPAGATLACRGGDICKFLTGDVSHGSHRA